MNNQAKISITAEDRTAAAFAEVSRRVDKLGFGLSSLKGAAVGALAALSVPITAGAIIGLANEAAKAIDELKGLGEATGSSVENISALDKIARSTGGSFDTVSGVLIKFNAALKDAERTKEIGAILKALNLEIDDLRRLDPAQALQKTAIALEGFADSGDKARAVQELFGRSVKDAAPFLRDLAEAGKLNATVTGTQAEEVDKFNKQLSRLQSNAQDVARSLSVDVITALNRVISRFQDGEKVGKGFFDTALRIYGENVREFYGLSPKFSPSGAGGGRGFTIPDLARPDLDVSGEASDPKKPPKPPRAPRSGGGASIPRDPFADGQRYLDSLRNQLKATENLTVYEQLLAEIRDGSLGKLNPQLEEQLKNTAMLIDQDKELNRVKQEFADIAAETAKSQLALKDEARGFYDATRTPIERLNIELARQDELLRKLGASYKDTYMRANEAAQDRYEAETKVTEVVSELDKFTQQAAANIQDAFGDTFANILDGNFKNVGDSFTKLINKLVAEAAAANLSKYLFGDLVKGGNGGGIFGKALGNFASSIFSGAPKFATGTDFVPRDMLAVVHKGEAIIPAQRNLGGGGQTVNVSNSFALSGPVDRRTQQQIAQLAGAAVQRATARNG